MVKRFITTLTSVCLAFGMYAESKSQSPPSHDSFSLPNLRKMGSLPFNFCEKKHGFK